nr:ATP-binding protein [Streptomyces xanthophaeus]
MTSELVSNAIRHGGGLLDFSAAVVEDGLQLVVTDASRDAPFVTPRRAGTVPVGGFGWPLVLRLARSVTIRPTEQGGKSIVAVLPLDGPVGPARASAGR